MERVTFIEATLVMKEEWSKEQVFRLEELIRHFLAGPDRGKFVSIWVSKFEVRDMEILPHDG